MYHTYIFTQTVEINVYTAHVAYRDIDSVRVDFILNLRLLVICFTSQLHKKKEKKNHSEAKTTRQMEQFCHT